MKTHRQDLSSTVQWMEKVTALMFIVQLKIIQLQHLLSYLYGFLNCLYHVRVCVFVRVWYMRIYTMHVCIWGYMHVCMYMRIYSCEYVCIWGYMHVSIYAYEYIFMWVCMYLYRSHVLFAVILRKDDISTFGIGWDGTCNSWKPIGIKNGFFCLHVGCYMLFQIMMHI